MPAIKDSFITPERVRMARHLGELIEDRAIFGSNFDGIAKEPVFVNADAGAGSTNRISVGTNRVSSNDLLSNPHLPGGAMRAEALIRTNSDARRPHLATTEYKHIYEFLTRISNPIDKP